MPNVMTLDNKPTDTRSLVQDIWKLFGHINGHHRRQIALLLILMLVTAMSEVVSLGAAFPFLSALSNSTELFGNPKIQPLLSLFKVETPKQLVTHLTLLFIGVSIATNALRILTIKIRTHVANHMAGDLSCRLYKQILLQPYRFYTQHNSSDIIQTVMDDARQLSSLVIVPLLMLVTNIFVIVALVGGLFLVDASIALILTSIFLGSYLCLYRLRSNLLNRNSRIIVESNQRKIKVVQEGIGGIRDVILGGSYNFFQSAYQLADYPFRKAFASNIVIAQTPRYGMEALAMTTIGFLALLIGRDGDFSQALPILGSLALGANRLLPVIQQSFVAIAHMQGSRASLQRVLRGLNRPVNSLQMWTPSEELPLREDIRFENIWFQYDAENGWVLRNFSLSIAAGTTVALVGSTGSGKSTTADLLLGLLQPQKGVILVDGQPLEGERLRQWQQTIAHVPQSIFLADATITENIAFGIPIEQVDLEQVRNAAQLAQIDQYIEKLPAKYDTFVGERGIRLSGGQRQRIGIARALYRQASVIVFDEATSALDNSTEREVMAAINRLKRHFTIVLIAHRLSTVKQCDQIFELHDGQLIAQGTYKDLLAQSPSFQCIAQSL